MTKPLIKFSDYTDAVWDAMESVSQSALDSVVHILKRVHSNYDTVFVCGNGGSAAIANHLVCDCMKGVATDHRHGKALKVVSLVSNIPLTTAIANDIGYDQVFSKQLEWQFGGEDVLIVISSSGNSQNIIEVLNTAIEIEMRTIAIVGFDGGKAAEIADHTIHIKSDNYGVIEDVSQAVMHYIAQALRRDLSNKNSEDIKY
jgi:phosphoheptose isomerase